MARPKILFNVNHVHNRPPPLHYPSVSCHTQSISHTCWITASAGIFAVMHPFFFSFPFLLILQYSFSNKKHFCRSLTHYPLTVLILLRLFVVEDVLYSLISMHTIQPDAPDDTEIEKKTNAPSISYFFWPSPHIQYKRHCFMTIQPADQYQSTMWFALQVTTLR